MVYNQDSFQAQHTEHKDRLNVATFPENNMVQYLKATSVGLRLTSTPTLYWHPLFLHRLRTKPEVKSWAFIPRRGDEFGPT